MVKYVHWEPNVNDTIIKKTCLCEGCSNCRNRTGMYCDKFTEYKCNECKDYRCIRCLYTKEICNYCKRIA